MDKPVNFNSNDVYIDMERKGCEWCMTYNWKTRKEVPSDFSQYKIEGRNIKYCPFCGRELN